MKPRYYKAIMTLCNHDLIMVLGVDSRGNYVVAPTKRGALAYHYAMAHGLTGVCRLLEGAS